MPSTDYPDDTRWAAHRMLRKWSVGQDNEHAAYNGLVEALEKVGLHIYTDEILDRRYFTIITIIKVHV